MKNILIASGKSEVVNTIRNCLAQTYNIETSGTAALSYEMFLKKRYDFLFIELTFLDADNSSTDFKKQLKPFWQAFPDSEIIVITEQKFIRRAVDAVRAGASDYLSLPLNPHDINYIVERIEQQNIIKSELNYLRNVVLYSDSVFHVKTNSDLMKDVYSSIRSVANTDSTVLITGETGTGKGYIAKLIHQFSKRSENQFISVHCGAIPDNLLESDLFGHEKGAFTGAVRRKLGKFEIAQGGTIFLDEIGTISAQMQVKLLQVLQDKMFYRVGGEQPIASDVRIIAATNSDLDRMSEEGTFRTDLFYRLNVFQIEMPPLRARKEDLPLLTEVILARLNKFNNKEINDLHPEVIQAFEEYDWPGNIRELENLLERAVILETTNTLTPKSFPIRLFKDRFKKYVSTVDTSKTLEEVRKSEIDRIEKEYLAELLTKFHGKINLTAQAAGIGERQLHKLMTKYNLVKEDFKTSDSENQNL